MFVRSIRPIRQGACCFISSAGRLMRACAGEEVTSSYTALEMRTTAERRAELRAAYAFDCECERCAVPDFKVGFASVVCVLAAVRMAASRVGCCFGWLSAGPRLHGSLAVPHLPRCLDSGVSPIWLQGRESALVGVRCAVNSCGKLLVSVTNDVSYQLRVADANLKPVFGIAEGPVLAVSVRGVPCGAKGHADRRGCGARADRLAAEYVQVC